MKILTITAGNSGSITLPYCPQFLLIKGTGAASVQAKLKVNVAGFGLTTDLNNDGLNGLGQAGFVTPLLTNSTGRGSLIELADGVLKSKTTDVSLTNDGAESINVFALSINEGQCPIKSTMLNVLANSEQKFDKFYRLMVNNPDSDDEIAVTCVDGTNNRLSTDELFALQALTTSICSPTDGSNIGYIEIDNKEQILKEVSYIAKDSTRTFVVQTIMVSHLLENANTNFTN